MIDYDRIDKRVTALKDHYGSACAREIVEGLGIGLLEMPMGKSETALKGFIQKNCRMITIGLNSDLPEDVQDKVLLHEIGHHQQGHLDTFRSGLLQDTSFLPHPDMTGLERLEHEANLFAADYMLNTDDTLEAIHEYDFDLSKTARSLYVPIEFLDYKLRLLYQLGRFDSYNDILSVKNDFMRRIRTGQAAAI